jgi:Na+-translocating ferredoxin:NAD+ oxidoreductase subunit A
MSTGTLELALGSIFVSNFVLAKCLGLTPIFATTRRLRVAAATGLAIVPVMAVAAVAAALVERHVLLAPSPDHVNLLAAVGLPVPCGAWAILVRTLLFILIIAAQAEAVAVILRRAAPGLHRTLGPYVPLIAINSAVLGAMLLGTEAWRGAGGPGEVLGPMQAAVLGLSGGVGLWLVIVLMASIRERLEEARVPRAMRGLPIALVSAGLMALAFQGFARLFGVAG